MHQAVGMRGGLGERVVCKVRRQSGTSPRIHAGVYRFRTSPGEVSGRESMSLRSAASASASMAQTAKIPSKNLTACLMVIANLLLSL